MTDEQATNLLATLPRTTAEAISNRARERQKNVQTIVTELLELGLRARSPARTKLSDFSGSWEEDPSFEEAIAAFETIDENLWR